MRSAGLRMCVLALAGIVFGVAFSHAAPDPDGRFASQDHLKVDTLFAKKIVVGTAGSQNAVTIEAGGFASGIWITDRTGQRSIGVYSAKDGQLAFVVNGNGANAAAKLAISLDDKDRIMVQRRDGPDVRQIALDDLLDGSALDGSNRRTRPPTAPVPKRE